MNMITTAQNGMTARLFAFITVVSLLMSAFPVAFFVAEAATGSIELSALADPDEVSDSDGEYIEIAFTGTGSVDLTDWTIEEGAGLLHTIGSFSVDSSTSYISCTNGDEAANNAIGCDEEWSPGGALNNGSDTVTLNDASGNIVATLSLAPSAGVVESGEFPYDNTSEENEDDTSGDTDLAYNDDGKVQICKFNNGDGGQYVSMTPSVNSAGELTGGHTNDQGTAPQNIIPPYEYMNEQGELQTYAGQNWETGQTIWEDGCQTSNPDPENPDEPELPELDIPQQCSVLEELVVPADNAAGANTTATLENGRDYFAVVEGTYTFGNPKNGNERLADAEYSLEAGDTDWMKEFDSARPNVLDLLIDGVNPDFGAFRSDHTYGTFFSGTGATSNFAIEDDPYNDNSGELNVTIYECDPEEEPEVPQVCSIAGEVVAITEDAVKYDGSPVDSNRRSTTSLETAASYINFYGQEGNGWSPADFLTLGVEGSVTYKFTEKVATDEPGDDIAIWEITGGDTNTQSNASAIVEVSQDGATFVTVDTLTGDGSIDIAGTGLDYVQYVRLTDDSAAIGADDGGDGYDVDAITIINDSCASIPEPVQCTVTLTSDDTNTVVEKGDAFAVVLDFIHNTWTTSLANADWIWGDQGPTNPAESESQTFVNQFGWNGDVLTDATLTIAADNSFVASLNGDSAAEELGEFNYSTTKDYDVTSLIESGNNELAVIVENFAGVDNPKKNPAGLYYELVINGEGENCEVPFIPEPEEPEYGPYCGDGEINQQWEQCDGEDTPEGESCTDYCTLDNQCTSEQLVKITLDDTAEESTSFDGSIHLDMAGNTIPNGTWFNFSETLGNESFVDIANAVEGLAVKRNNVDSKLELAYVGGNGSGQTDFVQGTIKTLGIDLGGVDRTPNPSFPLEDGSGRSYEDVFEKNGNDVDFDLRADTGNDAVTVEINQGDEYNCPVCQATVEARVVLNDSGYAGAGSDIENIVLGDDTYSTVEFGEWFPISQAANPGDSAVMINDPNTVTNFDAPADKPGLFVSRENGTVKVALYGELENSKSDNEWLDARIEVRDAAITNYAEMSGDFKFEDHPENDGVTSNDDYDHAVADSSGVDFELWVDVASDGFRFEVDTDSIVACKDDTIEEEPEDDMYRIDGNKFEYEGSLASSTPKSDWKINLVDPETDELLMSTTTDSSGYYYFDVMAGDYRVEEVVQSDWIQIGVQQDNNDYVYTDGDVEYCLFDVGSEGAEYDHSYESGDSESEDGYRCDFYNESTEDGSDDSTPPEDTQRRSSGNSSGGIPQARFLTPEPTEQVLGAATTNFCPFIEDYMQIGAENDAMEVMKLQLFLNVFKDTYGGTENPVTGTFGSITDANVKAFQETYRSEVLDPWFERGIVPHDRPTGFVYKTTLWKINDLVCPDYAVEPDFAGESLDANVDNNVNDTVRD